MMLDREEAPTKLEAFEKREYDATLGHLRHDRNGDRMNEQCIRVEIDNRSESGSITDSCTPKSLLCYSYYISLLMNLVITNIVHSYKDEM